MLVFLPLIVAACAPGADIRTVEPLAPILAPAFELVQGQTSIERFDPPGAGAGLEMTVGTLVRNPNAFAVRLTDVQYTVFLLDTPVLKGELRPDVFLEAGGTAPLRFPVTTGLGRRPALLRAVVQAFSDEPLPFRIEGSLRFASTNYAFASKNRTLVEGSTLARQSVQAPELRLDEDESRVYLLRPDVPVVHLVVDAKNPGDIGYFLYGKDLSLSLAGETMAKEDMRPFPLAAGRDGRIDILFYPSMQDLSPAGKAALDAALQGIPTLLRLQGELLMDVLGVDSFTVPSGWQVAGFVDADKR